MCGTNISNSASIFLLYHAEVPQGFPDGGFFFGRTVGDNLVGDNLIFLLGEIIVLAGGETEFAFGLGDLEAGDPEAEGVQNVSLDLIISGFALGCGEVRVLQVEGHADGHVRIFSDQLNNRLTRHFFVPTPAGRSDRGGADRRGLRADGSGDRSDL